METVLVGTPLINRLVSAHHSFGDGIEIRKLDPILWAEGVSANEYLSNSELRRIRKAQYWLTTTEEVTNAWSYEAQPLYEKLRRAMNALQILAPTGAQNIYMKFWQRPTGFDNCGSLHSNEMSATHIGKLLDLEEQGLEKDFDKVFAGVNRAFDGKIVRLQNPIILLEHGLQLRHVYLSTLMWVMGLDMLYMAGKKKPFIERVKKFLGEQSLVFPPVGNSNRQPWLIRQQPRMTVGEIVEDIFDLRNEIAHGHEIPKRLRADCKLPDTKSQDIPFVQIKTYAEALCDASLFILVNTLRKIMTDGLVEVVVQQKDWKNCLEFGVAAGLKMMNSSSQP